MLRLTQHTSGAEALPATVIATEFDDPYLELVRLLREASEIEHALLVQYLYASFSVKDAYSTLRGSGVVDAKSLVGVAIQEMQHLQAVNELLTALRAAPNLVRQDFPYEPAIYPFPFALEPLSLDSCAKYVFTEAPAQALDPDDPANASAEDQAFLAELAGHLPGGARPNHLGTLYGTIIGKLQEVITAAVPGLGDLSGFEVRLEHIRSEGEQEHYRFFRKVFTGTHDAFAAVSDVWGLDPADAGYPAVDLGANPSALPGHPNEIPDALHRRIAWLSDLHYWLVLGLLDLGYRTADFRPSFQAVDHMTIALRPLGTLLAGKGVGMPFDPLSMGYAPGHDLAGTVLVLRRLQQEAAAVAVELGPELPDAELYVDLAATTMTVLDALGAPAQPAPPTPAPQPDPTPSAEQAAAAAMEFWFDFDNRFLISPTPQADAAVDGLGNMEVLRARFVRSLAEGTFPETFIAAATPLDGTLRVLSGLQLEVFDKHFGNDVELQRSAFEHFGQGDLFDDRRPGMPVHMMDISANRPPIGYHRWHVVLRAMMVLDIDGERWDDIARQIALAWAIQAEAKPQQNAVNPPLPPARVAKLREFWTGRTIDQLDAAYAAGAIPAPAP